MCECSTHVGWHCAPVPIINDIHRAHLSPTQESLWFCCQKYHNIIIIWLQWIIICSMVSNREQVWITGMEVRVHVKIHHCIDLYESQSLHEYSMSSNEMSAIHITRLQYRTIYITFFSLFKKIVVDTDFWGEFCTNSPSTLYLFLWSMVCQTWLGVVLEGGGDWQGNGPWKMGVCIGIFFLTVFTGRGRGGGQYSLTYLLDPLPFEIIKFFSKLSRENPIFQRRPRFEDNKITVCSISHGNPDRTIGRFQDTFS